MEKDQRIKKRFFPVSIFSLSLVFFAVITTIQMKIIGKYIHADEISAVAVTGVFGFWFLGSVIFTFFTGWQVQHRLIKDGIGEIIYGLVLLSIILILIFQEELIRQIIM